MNTTLRIFIAIKVSQKPRQFLKNYITLLKPTIPASQVTWVKPENLHLTLKFLGDTNISQVEHITELIRHTTQNHKPIKTCLT